MRKFVRFFAAFVLLIASIGYLHANDQINFPIKKLVQEPQHQVVTDRILTRMSQSHYVPFTLNQAESEQIFDNYVDSLDPKRVLFLSSDLNGFSQERMHLTDELKSGKLKTAYELHHLLQLRFQQQNRYFLDLLKSPLSLDGNDSIQINREKLPRPNNAYEQQILWYNLVKNDVINLMLSGKDWSQTQDILAKRYQRQFRQFARMSSEDVYNLFINAFMATLDPHTSYLSPKDTEDFVTQMNLSMEGIGATLTVDGDYVSIVSLVPNGPADKSKQLLVGDRIVAIAQEGKPLVDVVGWPLDEVVTLIKGPRGSKVRLEVISKKKGPNKIITLVRDKIELEDAKVKQEIKQVDGRKVAVLSVPSFYLGVTKDTKRHLRTLLSDREVEGVVVDLRMNGGGALIEAIGLSDLFLPSSAFPVVQVKSSDGKIRIYTKDNTQSEEVNLLDYLVGKKNSKFYFDKPMVILVDKLSVSASEIFAAVMQDSGRAVVVGETTFGKGTVQDSVSLERIYDEYLRPEWKKLGSLRYTTQKFYRISGGSTQLKGVVPDLIMTPIRPELSELGERLEKNALPWDKIPMANYKKVNHMERYLSRLEREHNRRLAKNSDYQFVLSYYEQYVENRDKQRTLSLNLTQREKEMKADEGLVLSYVNNKLAADGKAPVTSLNKLPKEYQLPDIYLDEATRVTLDLADLLTKK